MADALMPATLHVVTEALLAQTAVTEKCGNRISYRLGATFPAIRLTDVGTVERAPEEALHRVQVECWAAKYDDAERLAASVVSVVSDLRGDWPSGYCAGGTVESGPFDSPDENSERFRVQLDLALWLYPSPA